MRIGYTEFSYGYAFTENLIRSSTTAPTGAPQFPNLVQEAQLGYDININFPARPLFFQFKLPDLMKKASAFEIKNGQCPGITTPFFRISMMRRDLSDQHQLLINWEGRYPNCVFYAAPTQSDVPAFDRAYNAARISATSVYFSPRDIGPLPDDRPHSIAYSATLPYAYFCSEPKRITALTFDKLNARVGQELQEHQTETLQEVMRQVNDDLLSIAPRQVRQSVAGMRDRITARRVSGAASIAARPPEVVETEVDILVAREIARVDLGLEMVIAQ
jgi:hypothetical protein